MFLRGRNDGIDGSFLRTMQSLTGAHSAQLGRLDPEDQSCECRLTA
jgi:hypothetical protein